MRNNFINAKITHKLNKMQTKEIVKNINNEQLNTDDYSSPINL
jgi:hypothetical protein